MAYVPQPLKGYAVFRRWPARDRDGDRARAWARSRPRVRPFDPALREPVRFLALRKTRDPDLLLGMLDRDADLRLVSTADKSLHYVLAENLDEFPQDASGHRRAARLGRRPARRADRPSGPARRVSASHRREPRRGARTSTRSGGQSAVEDPTLGQAIRPIWIKIDGPLDTVKVGVPDPAHRAGPAGEGEPRLLPDRQPGGHRLRRPTAWPTRSPRSRT